MEYDKFTDELEFEINYKKIPIDVLKCIGCRSCQVACKQWNELKVEKSFKNLVNFN